MSEFEGKGAAMQEPSFTDYSNSKENVPDMAKWNIEAAEKVPAAVIEHVKNNVVRASNSSSKCVDGGYQPGEATGELARPGGDLGLSILLLSFSRTPQEAFDIVHKFRLDAGQKFGWHTDHHADPDAPHQESQHAEHTDLPFCGCGHCVMAAEKAQSYDIDSNSPSSNPVQELVEIVREMHALHPEQFLFVNLDRDHKEDGVLIVKGTDFCVAPWDRRNPLAESQFFIYDADRDAELLKEFGQYLRDNNLLEVSDEQLADESQKHTDNTLGLLKSSRNKPIYIVDFNGADGKIKIEYLKDVEPLD